MISIQLFLSMSHIIAHNPIVYDSDDIKNEYLKRLSRYVKSGAWNQRKYEHAELCAYQKILSESTEVREIHKIEFYQYYILFDLMHILGYELGKNFEEKIKVVKRAYYTDFPEMRKDKQFVDFILSPVFKNGGQLKRLEKNELFLQEKEYIQLIQENIAFKEREPFHVMVTATMSAGKSTFINALAGKYICLSQNMSCTSKIHSIINKAFEDGYSYEYDHDLVMTAGKEELLNDNEANISDKIVVSTYFRGGLEKQRLVIHDSPGVNFSGDKEHKLITNKLIKSKNYHLLIYIMNATQLKTNDDDEHLDYVKKMIGRTPILFIINKVDAFNVEEEDVFAIIKKQTEYLKQKGFKYPMLCPISSKAGYLSKQFINGTLSKTEKKELYHYVDKFEEMNLPQYYKQAFSDIKIKDFQTEEEQLLKTSGLAYVEKIIQLLTAGGKVNVTYLR